MSTERSEGVRARAEPCAKEGDKWNNREDLQGRDDGRWVARYSSGGSLLEKKDLADSRDR